MYALFTKHASLFGMFSIYSSYILLKIWMMGRYHAVFAFWKKRHIIMSPMIIQFYLLTIRYDKYFNLMGDQITLFFVSLVFFKISLSRLTRLFVSVLFYACNMLSRIEYVVTVLWSKRSPHYPTWTNLNKIIWLCIISRSCVCLIKKILNLIPIYCLSLNSYSFFSASSYA